MVFHGASFVHMDAVVLEYEKDKHVLKTENTWAQISNGSLCARQLNTLFMTEY